MPGYEDVCRICLNEQPTISIFKSDILTKIHNCCTVQIYENDGLPSNICFNCANTLELVVEFKNKCEESDKILRSKINIAYPSDMKTELGIINTENPVILYDMPMIKDETFLNDDDNTGTVVEITSSSNKSDMLKQDKLYCNERTDNKCEKMINLDNNFADIVTKNSNISNLNSNKTPIKKNGRNSTKIKSSNIKDSYNKTKKETMNRKIFTGTCPHCGLNFPKGTFYKHVKTHKDKQYKCDVCGKCFHLKGNLTLHIKTHGEKECPCAICGRLFISTYEAFRHAEAVHKRSRAVECTECGKKLATISNLKMHIKTHTGEKPFECEICNQKFAFKYTLTLHMRTHTGEKPYACRFCDSRFSIKRTVREHERLHTGETPYHCPACDKGFSQLSNMKSHFKNNHKGVEFTNKYVRANERRKNDL